MSQVIHVNLPKYILKHYGEKILKVDKELEKLIGEVNSHTVGTVEWRKALNKVIITEAKRKFYWIEQGRK